MARFEVLIDLGLTTEQATLITTPIHMLTRESLSEAIIANDKKIGLISVLNDSFIPSDGFINIVSKDGFEAFQSPCDTNRIITNERERQDDLKRHNCIDAREFIPHGKTSLIDGQL